jgi:hypothetical protein
MLWEAATAIQLNFMLFLPFSLRHNDGSTLKCGVYITVDFFFFFWQLLFEFCFLDFGLSAANRNVYKKIVAGMHCVWFWSEPKERNIYCPSTRMCAKQYSTTKMSIHKKCKYAYGLQTCIVQFIILFYFFYCPGATCTFSMPMSTNCNTQVK